MSKHGCENCKYLRCYRGGRWDPDEYECVKDGPATTELCVRVCENGEMWSDDEEPLCDQYEKAEEEW